MVRMSSHHCRLIAAGFAVLLGALAPCPRPLLAQSRAGACDRRAEQEAKAYHAKGKKLARAKKYAAAATELELAQRLCPNPVLVLNLAEVAEKTKDLALAAYQYHRYLTLAPQGKGAKKAEQALQRIDAELARTHSLLELSSLPAAARVVLDDDEARLLETPLRLWLTAGMHHLQLSKEGFQPLERTLDTVEGGKQQLALRLEPVLADGLLSVAAQQGAKVQLDGKLIGLAPLSRYKVAPGEHELLLTLDAHEPLTAKVQITPGEHSTVTVELARVLHLTPPEGQGRAAGELPPELSALAGEPPAGRGEGEGAFSWLPVSLAAAGLLAAGGGVACLLQARGLDGEGDEIAGKAFYTPQELKQGRDEAESRYAEAARYKGLALGAGVLAVAALGMAATLWLLGPGEQPAAAEQAETPEKGSSPPAVLAVSPLGRQGALLQLRLGF